MFLHTKYNEGRLNDSPARGQAIAALAAQLGNATLAATFAQRAAWIQREYLALLWNPEIEFFSVYKENLQNNSKYHCGAGPDATAAAGAGQQGRAAAGNKPGCPLAWPCNKPAGVRELLGLGPPYYCPGPPGALQRPQCSA